jgi:hypothetical protein
MSVIALLASQQSQIVAAARIVLSGLAARPGPL